MIPLKRDTRKNYVYNPLTGVLLALSFKVGSRSVRAMQKPGVSLYQHEAQKLIADGTDCTLHVRHPLARLVSCWRWFTQVKTSFITREMLEQYPEQHALLMRDDVGFEEWADTALSFWNPHWYPQFEYHSTEDGLLIPTVIKDLKYLGETRLNTTVRTRSWESYYSKKLRKDLEEQYSNDIELYEIAKEAGPDGIRPTDGKLFQSTRRDIWYSGLEESDQGCYRGDSWAGT